MTSPSVVDRGVRKDVPAKVSVKPETGENIATEITGELIGSMDAIKEGLTILNVRAPGERGVAVEVDSLDQCRESEEEQATQR